MSENPRKTSLIDAFKWFDPRARSFSTIAFILNRITGLGLALYLFLHLFMLGTLAQGEKAYMDFTSLTKTPVILVGEMLVIAGCLIHGLNGLRIGFTSFGIGGAYQKQLFYLVMVISIAGCVIFGISMFSH